MIALGPASPASAQPAPVDVRILAINDSFHGNLRAAERRDPDCRSGRQDQKIVVPAGGAEHMATLVRATARGPQEHDFSVAAGDLIGASPFLSATFHDEPTIESLSMMGLEVASVGNHEFDEGKDELLANAEWRLSPHR